MLNLIASDGIIVPAALRNDKCLIYVGREKMFFLGQYYTSVGTRTQNSDSE